MVVGLALEGDGEAFAEVEDAGVLAGPLQDARAPRRQPLEQPRGVLVAAVLAPEEREDTNLEVVRVAAEQLPDTPRLAVSETESAV